MPHPEFSTIPVGNDEPQGYAVRRDHNGEVHYLAARLDPSKIGRYSLELAEGTCKVFRCDPTHDRATQQDTRWLPWPTDHLPYGKPMSAIGHRAP